MNRKRFLFACAVTGVFALAGNASAYPGGNTTTNSSTLGTIGVSATAADNSYCSYITVFGADAWQCTPTATLSASAYHPLLNLGGTLSWSGSATCEYRKRADGLNNNWTNWTSCGPFTKYGSGYRSWGILATPGSGTVTLSWPRIENVETAFATDCVEIHVSVSSTSTGTSPLETISTSASTGTHTDGICEGGSMY